MTRKVIPPVRIENFWDRRGGSSDESRAPLLNFRQHVASLANGCRMLFQAHPNSNRLNPSTRNTTVSMANNITVYVVEDRALTRETIIMSLQELGFDIAGQHDEAEKAFEEMCQNPPDIAILDIDLIGDKNGIWLGHQLREELDIPFIYLTAFGDTATMEQAMASKPHGFLMKPYNEANIRAAILIAVDNFAQSRVAKPTATPPEPAEHRENFKIKDSLFVKDNYMLVRLKIADILYLKSDGKYVEIVLEGKKHLVRSKLSEYAEHLGEEQFQQVHLRYIVNVNCITAFGGGYVQVAGADIPVSKNYKEALQRRIVLL